MCQQPGFSLKVVPMHRMHRKNNNNKKPGSLCFPKDTLLKRQESNGCVQEPQKRRCRPTIEARLEATGEHMATGVRMDLKGIMACWPWTDTAASSSSQCFPGSIKEAGGQP